MKKKKQQISDEQLYATIASIEKQLAKPLKGLGKVYMPKKTGSSLQRSVSVESRTKSTIHVTVTHEHTGSFSATPTGLYSVLVQEVRSADSRVKYRAKIFPGLPAKLTNEHVETITACVKKHLDAADEVRLVQDARYAERERAEQTKKEHHARLRKIGKVHGYKHCDHGSILGDAMSVYSEGPAGYRVTLHLSSDPELEEFLAFWKQRGTK